MFVRVEDGWACARQPICEVIAKWTSDGERSSRSDCVEYLGKTFSNRLIPARCRADCHRSGGPPYQVVGDLKGDNII